MDLVLHPETQQKLGDYLAGNAHAFMLVGPSGSGKLSVALHMSNTLLEAESANHPGFRLISPEKGSIGIEAVRDVQHFLRLKTTGTSRVRRVLVVQDAHRMTTEAQNAFLKLLEEPPADTRLILTVADGQSVLTTIQSRVQSINLQSPSKTDVTHYFSQQGRSVADVEKAYLLSGGQVGLMAALLNQESQHPLLEYVDRAKTFLGASAYERLARLDAFAKDREELSLFIQALKRMSSTAFEQSTLQNKTAQAKHWHKIRTAVINSEAMLGSNPNVKLLLTDLSLNL